MSETGRHVFRRRVVFPQTRRCAKVYSTTLALPSAAAIVPRVPVNRSPLTPNNAEINRDELVRGLLRLPARLDDHPRCASARWRMRNVRMSHRRMDFFSRVRLLVPSVLQLTPISDVIDVSPARKNCRARVERGSRDTHLGEFDGLMLSVPIRVRSAVSVRFERLRRIGAARLC